MEDHMKKAGKNDMLRVWDDFLLRETGKNDNLSYQRSHPLKGGTDRDQPASKKR
jgi:hypothetical protein